MNLSVKHREKLHDIGCNNDFLDVTLKSTSKNIYINTLDIMKISNCCAPKDTYQECEGKSSKNLF